MVQFLTFPSNLFLFLELLHALFCKLVFTMELVCDIESKAWFTIDNLITFCSLSCVAFVAYLGFVNVLVAHSHPVMLMFCQLLVNRNKDRDLAGSQPQKKSVDEHQGSSKENGTSAGMYLVQ